MSPINPTLAHHYRTPAWLDARARALVRATYRCEACRKPDGEWVYTVTRAAAGEMFWAFGRTGTIWRNQHGVLVPFRPAYPSEMRRIQVRLAVAHANNDPTDNSDENLRVWCQWHHITGDKHFHAQTRSERKDRARPIISEGASA